MASVGTTAGVAGNVNEAMKIIFQDPISENFVQDSELLDMFQQDTRVFETVGGRYIELAHYFELPAGVGARKLEGDYIPVPDGPVIKNSQIFLKKIEGVVEMSGDTMRRVRTNEGAFLDWAERALPDLVTRVNNELDRMLVGFGPGALARVNEAVPTSPVLIDSPFGLTTPALTKAWINFLEGMRVVFGPNIDGTGLRVNGGATPYAAQVTDVNPDTGEITVVLPSDIADNDFIFTGDAAGQSVQASGVDREIMGLLGMVDDGTVLATFQGLARASYRKWNSIIVDAATEGSADGELSELTLTVADNRVRQRGGGKPDTIVTSVEGLISYWQSLVTDRVLNDPRSFTGGKSRVNVILGDRSLELRSVRKMPPELTFMCQKDTFKRWHNAGWEWDDKTGAIWNRVTDATGRMDAFYAVGHIVLQTGNVAPRKNVRIQNLDLAAYV